MGKRPSDGTKPTARHRRVVSISSTRQRRSINPATSALVAPPLGWFQGQHQLSAGFEPAAVHLTDVITVLAAAPCSSSLASPRAEAAQF
jgi:hypothetical protein